LIAKVGAWLKKWWGVLVAVLLALLGAGWLWGRARQLGQVKDQLAVEQAKQEIARLRGERAQLAERVGEKDDAIVEVDRQLAQNQRAIVEAHEGGEGLTDEEVAAAFDRLGY
jgi:uncharacterized protein HemX